MYGYLGMIKPPFSLREDDPSLGTFFMAEYRDERGAA